MITIIVLLILAGISIQMLTGDNGILTRAAEAKTRTDEAQIKERIQLAYHSALTKDITGENGELTMPTLQTELNNEFVGKTVTITPNADNKEWTIEVDGVKVTVTAGKDGTPQVARITVENGTAPYFPSSAFSQVDGTNLSSGLVITDEINEEGNSIGNEYVWIEVPSTYVDSSTTAGPDYSAVTGEKDYTNIAAALRNWVSNLITEANGTEATRNSNTTTCGNKDEWYDGCGIVTKSDYNDLYHTMLTSVYKNGGFWIGRYEAGQIGNTGRTDKGVLIDGVIPLSKPNLIPIFYVTCSQAQTIATRVQNIGSYKSSLMFGIQWDLVVKHLNRKGVTSSELVEDSSSWGNYSNSTNVILKGGKYTQYMQMQQSGPPINTFNTWREYSENLGDYVKNKVLNNTSMPQSILLSTGASNQLSKKNIYDLAGNLAEFTLEHEFGGTCVLRGANYASTGTSTVSSHSEDWNITDSNNLFGLRVSLY